MVKALERHMDTMAKHRKTEEKLFASEEENTHKIEMEEIKLVKKPL